MQGRSRFQQRRFLLGLSWSLLTGAGLWFVLGFLRWVGVIQNSLFVHFIPLALLVLWMVGLSIYIAQTAPSLAHVAQKADRHFALNERISTALEVVQRSPRDGFHAFMYQALEKDAAAQTGLLNPQELVRLEPPRTLIYALLVGILALGVQALPVLSQKAAPLALGLPREEQAATVTQLQRITKVVQRDAERANDPYLQATVRSLEQLKNDIQAGRLSGPQAQEEITRLSEQLEKGYNLPNSPNSTDSHLATPQGNQPSANPPQTRPNQEENSARPGSRISPQVQRPPSASPSQSLNNLANRLESKSQTSSNPKAPPAAQAQQQADCVGQACTNIYAKAQAQQAKDAGSAKNQVKRQQGGSAGGFGNEAGKEGGGKSGARGTALPARPKAQQVKLPFQTPQSGRRIQISAPPSTVKAPDATGTVQAQNWTRQEEVPTNLDYLETQNRTIVSNYFAPPKETP